MISKPEPSEYNPFYAGYIALVVDKDIEQFLKEQLQSIVGLFTSMPDQKVEYAYAEGKWTIKQLLRHMIDAERIFGYRILTLARKDGTSLPGFEEGDYIASADDSENNFSSLLEEFELLRKSNIAMISLIHPSTYTFVGTVNNAPASTRALIFILAGHAAHHMKIVNERYL